MRVYLCDFHIVRFIRATLIATRLTQWRANERAAYAKSETASLLPGWLHNDEPPLIIIFFLLLFIFISLYLLNFSIAAGCYTVHYVKRLLETIFVHRFSHNTMPLRNLFKNCSYYWGFTAYVSYHVNHPLYTSPCMCTVWAALGAFAVRVCLIINLEIILVIVSPLHSSANWVTFPFTLLCAICAHLAPRCAGSLWPIATHSPSSSSRFLSIPFCICQ